MAQRIQLRCDTIENWTESNPILAQAEPGAVLTAGVITDIRYGDGTTAFLSLPSFGGGDVESVNGNTGVVVLDTDDIAEGTNQYFTSERVDDRVNALLVAGSNITLTYDDNANTLTIASSGGGGGGGTWGSITGTLSDQTDLQAALDLKAETTNLVGVQDLYIPASAMWPRNTGGCAALVRSEMTTSLVNLQTLDFDQTTQEFAQFSLVLPRKWNNGTVTATVYWTAAAGSGTVQWGISGGAYSNDDALTVALGTAQTSDDTLIATNDLHISPATSAITLAGVPADADFLAIQISRNTASDTLTGDAKLIGVSLRITTDAGVDA